MQFRNKLAAWTAAAALGAGSLFAVETPTARQPHEQHWRSEARFGQYLAKYLNLSPQQRTQEKTIFQGARQESQPVQHLLMQTRQSLQTAIKANDMDQIKSLSATEGNEIGQLTAIRSSAFAKAYQMLTPNQQQKLSEFQASHQSARFHRRGVRPNATQNGSPNEAPNATPNATR
jgi:Spy/CpxP family protein refolding chaperone